MIRSLEFRYEQNKFSLKFEIWWRSQHSCYPFICTPWQIIPNLAYMSHWAYYWRPHMLCTAQLGGPVLKAFGRVQYTPFQLTDKSPMITDQHTAGGSVSQLSQLAKLSPWLTLSTKNITTSFWHYNKWFCFLSIQIMGLYHFSNSIKSNLCIYGEKLCIYGEK